ncbi:MAG: DNA repair protein RecO [Candidatus Dojkabacteria bacterium]
MRLTQSYKGIIYRVFNSGSQDKVAYIILEDGSKLASFAKSVKKAGSRKAHGLEIGNLVNIKAITGSTLATLIEISVINDFSPWKKDLKSIALLQLICEVVDDFCYEENKDVELYKILYNTLLESREKKVLACAIFLIKLLNHSGVLPELDKSLATDEQLNSENVYSMPGEVGYVSDSTVKENSYYSNSDKVSSRIYKAQRYILENDFKMGIKLKLDPEEEIKLLRTHLEWLENTMSVKINSREILNSVL